MATEDDIEERQELLEENEWEEVDPRPFAQKCCAVALKKFKERKHDAWLLQCPKGMDPNRLLGRKVKLPGRKYINNLQLRSNRYMKKRNLCVGYVSSKGNFALRKLVFSGYIIAGKRMKANEPPARALLKANAKRRRIKRIMVPVRHPFFGGNFKNRIEVPKEISKKIKKADEKNLKLSAKLRKNANFYMLQQDLEDTQTLAEKEEAVRQSVLTGIVPDFMKNQNALSSQNKKLGIGLRAKNQASEPATANSNKSAKAKPVDEAAKFPKFKDTPHKQRNTSVSDNQDQETNGASAGKKKKKKSSKTDTAGLTPEAAPFPKFKDTPYKQRNSSVSDNQAQETDGASAGKKKKKKSSNPDTAEVTPEAAAFPKFKDTPYKQRKSSVSDNQAQDTNGASAGKKKKSPKTEVIDLTSGAAKFPKLKDTPYKQRNSSVSDNQAQETDGALNGKKKKKSSKTDTAELTSEAAAFPKFKDTPHKQRNTSVSDNQAQETDGALTGKKKKKSSKTDTAELTSEAAAFPKFKDTPHKQRNTSLSDNQAQETNGASAGKKKKSPKAEVIDLTSEAAAFPKFKDTSYKQRNSSVSENDSKEKEEDSAGKKRKKSSITVDEVPQAAAFKKLKDTPSKERNSSVSENDAQKNEAAAATKKRKKSSKTETPDNVQTIKIKEEPTSTPKKSKKSAVNGDIQVKEEPATPHKKSKKSIENDKVGLVKIKDEPIPAPAKSKKSAAKEHPKVVVIKMED